MALEDAEPRVDDVRVGDLLDLVENTLALLGDGFLDVQEVDVLGHPAFHEGAPFIVLDPADPHLFVERDPDGEALLLEEGDGKVVGKGQEVVDPFALHVRLQVVEHHGAHPADLELGGDGKKGDLHEVAVAERAEAHPAHGHRVAQKDDGAVLGVEHQAGDVRLGHLGQLAAKDVLDGVEPDEVLGRAVVPHGLEQQRPRVFRLPLPFVVRPIHLNLGVDGHRGGQRESGCRALGLPSRRARGCGAMGGSARVGREIRIVAQVGRMG